MSRGRGQWRPDVASPVRRAGISPLPRAARALSRLARRPGQRRRAPQPSAPGDDARHRRTDRCSTARAPGVHRRRHRNTQRLAALLASRRSGLRPARRLVRLPDQRDRHLRPVQTRSALLPNGTSGVPVHRYRNPGTTSIRRPIASSPRLVCSALSIARRRQRRHSSKRGCSTRPIRSWCATPRLTRGARRCRLRSGTR